MIPVIEKGIISEPELIDFIMGYKKLVKANIMSETSFRNMLEGLGITIGYKDEIFLDENNIYTLSV